MSPDDMAGLAAGMGCFFFLPGLLFCLLAAKLASRKNRSVPIWAILGFIFPLPTIIILLLSSHLCPRCHRNLIPWEVNSQTCDVCGFFGVRRRLRIPDRKRKAMPARPAAARSRAEDTAIMCESCGGVPADRPLRGEQWRCTCRSDEGSSGGVG